MEWKPLRVRLRTGKDDDIGKALENLSETEDKSDIVRAALRYYLLKDEKARPVVRNLEGEETGVVDLVKIEKDDDQLDAALDDLFNDF